MGFKTHSNPKFFSMEEGDRKGWTFIYSFIKEWYLQSLDGNQVKPTVCVAWLAGTTGAGQLR